MTHRNALEAAYEESMLIDSDTGIAIESLLETWSKRQPLLLTDTQIETMRVLLTVAEAATCIELFEAALRGERVVRAGVAA